MYIRMIKRRIGSIVIALMAVLMLGACSDSGKEENYMMINAEKAKEMMDKTEEFVLLDVRSREEFSLEHIPGAIVIPHDEIIAKAEGAIKNKDIPVFVYCRSGNRSKIAAESLVSLGYKNVYEFGGINSWPYETES